MTLPLDPQWVREPSRGGSRQKARSRDAAGLSLSAQRADKTLLDGIETTVSTYLVLPIDVEIHRGWERDRHRIYDRMADLCHMMPWHIDLDSLDYTDRAESGTVRRPPSLSRTAAFARCGSEPIVMRSRTDPGTYMLCRARCHDRLCRPCALIRGRRIAAKLAAKLSDHPYKLITLTLAHSHTRLGEQLDRLLRSWRLLRGTPLWRRKVRGSLGVVEITWSTERREWHPHLHIIADAAYIPQHQLRDQWHDVTGDSHIVDIRLIRDVRQVVTYVTQYVTKIIPRSIVDDPGALGEIITDLRGRRTIIPTGRWLRWRLLSDPEEKEWEYYGTLDAIRYWATQDDALAAAVLAAIESLDPDDEPIITVPDPPPRPDRLSDDDRE